MSAVPPILLRATELFHPRAASSGDPLDLRGVALEFIPRTFTLVSGGAGSGAGLLLRILGLRERPQAGEVYLAGQAAGPLDETSRLELRNRAFGFVFAEPFLLDSFTVAENIAMPLFKISCLDLEKARQRTAELLGFVGLAGAADDAISDLSPLAQQKLAVARALANAPQVLLVEEAGLHLPADERPEFFQCLRAVKETYGLAVIAHATGEPGETGADRELRLERGRLVAVAEEEARANE